MSWSLERKAEGWLVINEEDGEAVGCHAQRVDAIKQQRALYTRDSMVAAMYDELDAQPEVMPETVFAPAPVEAVPPVLASALSPLAAELVGLLLKDEREKSLVASMADSQSLISQQLHEAREDRQALVAALGRMGSPTINLPPAEVNVHVPQAQVDVHVPAAEVTVNVPDVNVTVDAPNVTVRPEIVLPSSQKTVTFERDPLTQQVTRAEVTEG